MTVSDATRADLTRIGQSDTPEGQSCLALAEAIDTGRALMAQPAMVKELRACLDVLRARAPQEVDAVDEIAARRAARLAGRADPAGAERAAGSGDGGGPGGD